MADSRFVDAAEPEDAFAALANETRIAILRALWEADGREATFAELRSAVGNPDSGGFSYHLDELVGRFLARTDEGYALTQAGAQVNGAIDAGAYTMEGTLDPVALDDRCRVCGGPLEFRYEDEVVRVHCDACPAATEFSVPPGALAGYDRDAVPRVADRYLRTSVRHLTAGLCWYCDGRVQPTVAPAPEVLDADEVRPADVPPSFDGRADDVPWVRFDCERCGTPAKTGLDHALLEHPAVAGFYHDHGVDVRERPAWAFPPVDVDRLAVRSRDPLRASVTYECGGDGVTLVVDRSLDVVAVES